MRLEERCQGKGYLMAEEYRIEIPEGVFRERKKARYIKGEKRNDDSFPSATRREHLELQRGMNVQKANFLINEGHFDLTLREMKIACYMASLLRPEEIDSEDEYITYRIEYVVNVGELLDVLGLPKDGRTYSQIRESFKSLRDKSAWVKLPNGRNSVVAWFDRVEEDPDTGEIHVKFDDRIVPYITALRDNFLLFSLNFIIPMKHKFSISLYESLKSYYCCKMSRIHTRKTDSPDDRLKKSKMKLNQKLRYRVTPDDVRTWLCLNGKKKYRIFTNLEREIEKAVEEINKYTEMHISYEREDKGRGVQVRYITFEMWIDKDKDLLQRVNNSLIGRQREESVENRERKEE